MGKLLVVDDDEPLRRLMRLELGDRHEIMDTAMPEEGLAVDLPTDSIVDVFLVSHDEDYVGQARVVHSDTKTASIRRYGCCFVTKTGAWILR